MNFLKQLQILKIIDDLIRKQSTGSPGELAQRLNISRTSVFYYINLLKKFGAPISYSRRLKSYFYKESFTLIL